MCLIALSYAQLGENAPVRAAMQADAVLEKRDLGGYAVFQRIVRAAEELLSKERPPLPETAAESSLVPSARSTR